MRTSLNHFAQGMGAGLAVAGAALFFRAMIRRRAKPKIDRTGLIVVDGARPADPILLSVRATDDVSSASSLRSEQDDYDAVSQRW